MTDEIQAAANDLHVEPILPPEPEPLREPAADPSLPATAAERLRAFEDKHLGVEAVRIGGRVERGFGSPYKELDPELRRQHLALEHLIDTEANLAAAHTALLQAETDHEAALAAAEPKPDGE